MYIDSVFIFVDFLRSNLQDPLNRISFENTNSEIVTNEKRFFKVEGVGAVDHIRDVRHNGVELVKYKDWIYDTYNQMIILFEPIDSGELTYDLYVGQSWVYHDRPIESLNTFPRVTVTAVSQQGDIQGNDMDRVFTIHRLQINTFTKKKQVVNIPIAQDMTARYSNQELANKINDEIYVLFRDNRDIFRPYYTNFEFNEKRMPEGINKQTDVYSTRQQLSCTQYIEFE